MYMPIFCTLCIYFDTIEPSKNQTWVSLFMPMNELSPNFYVDEKKMLASPSFPKMSSTLS